MGFRAAEGYSELGMWPEVLEELGELPGELRAMPPVLRLELRCCVALESWEQGGMAARQLRNLGIFDKMMAAGFYATLGREMLRRGHSEQAKDALHQAIETWPSCKEVVLSDPSLVAALL